VLLRRAPLALLLLLLAACGGADFVYFESITSGPNPGSTFVVVWLSDSPADDADAVEVSVNRVELVGGSGSVELSTDVHTVDLLSLQNGVRLKLAEANIDPGDFERVRLTLIAQGTGSPRLRQAGTWQPLGFVGPTAHVIEVPYAISGSAGATVEVQVDFNVRTSLIDVGGDLQLDPQLDAVDPTQAGRIEGSVLTTLDRPVPDAVVVLRRAGLEFRSTRTRADGTYILTPLTPGTYSLEVVGPVGVLAVANDVAVNLGPATIVDLFIP
jgi:hypothetical protein